MSDSTPATAATCHCGRPATDTEYAPNMGDYCDDCSLARCDIISAVDCPHYQPTTAAGSVVYQASNGLWYGRCDYCKTIHGGWKSEDDARTFARIHDRNAGHLEASDGT